MNQIAWAAQSDRGLVREINEDAYSVVPLAEGGGSPFGDAGRATITAPGILFTVCDGVGGGQAGEVASGLGVSALPEALAASCHQPHDDPSNRECAERMDGALRRTNGRVRQEAAADPARAGMCSTVSALWLAPGRAVLGQVGDSRIYRYRRGELRQLSRDQSEIARLVRTGQLSEADAKLAPDRRVIEQALGVRESTFAPEVDWVEPQVDDLYLLCSDGLVDRLEDAQLADILRAGTERRPLDLPALAAELIRRGNESSGRDNVTVVLVHIEPPEPAAALASPAAHVPEQTAAARALPRSAAESLGAKKRSPLLLIVGGIGVAVAAAGLAVGAFWLLWFQPTLDAARLREAQAQQAARTERENAVRERDRLRAELEASQRQSAANERERLARIRELESQLAAPAAPPASSDPPPPPATANADAAASEPPVQTPPR